MIPKELSEVACSLLEGKDRLVISLFLRINEDGEVLGEPRWQRSVVRSSCQLDYTTAQKMIDGNFHKEEGCSATAEVLNEVAQRVGWLNTICRALHRRRVEGGMLSLQLVRYENEHGEDGGIIAMAPEGDLDAHRLISELMHLCNVHIARKLTSTFQEGVVLRQRPAPDPKKLLELDEKCKLVNVELDTSSSAAFQASLSQLRKAHDELFVEGLVFWATRSLNKASYEVTWPDSPEGSFHHYDLHELMYCHFSSPIRRYVDMLAHYQLSAILNCPENPCNPFSPVQLQVLIKHCNVQKRISSRAESETQKVCLAAYVGQRPHEMSGVDAVVLELSSQKMTVLVPFLINSFSINFGDKSAQWTVLSAKDGVVSVVNKSGVSYSLQLLCTTKVDLVQVSGVVPHVRAYLASLPAK